ncbi:cryptochrome/photolyase family protein, partial [Acinetobacter baumannii]
AIFAAMRAFGEQLRAAGHRVRYIRLDDPSNRQSLVDNLDALAAHYQASRVEWQAPDEWRVDQALQQWGDTWAQAHQGQTAVVDSEHFLTAR